MIELGQSNDPRAFVPGDPAAVRGMTATIMRIGNAIETAGSGLARLDDGGWKGEAADAFHSYFDGQPKNWLQCADAFQEAANALASYVGVLDWAQMEAADAIRIWNQGQAVTDQARRDHDQQAQQSGAPAPPFMDPGEAQRQAAQQLLSRARVQLHGAGEQANAAVARARDLAPPEPSFLSKLGTTAADFSGGIWESVRDIGKFAWTVDPARLYVEPRAALQGWETLGNGIASAVTHPVEAGKAIIDWDTWKQNPARAVGHLVPDIALLGLGSVTKAGRAGEALADLDKARLAERGSAIAGRDLARGLARQSQLSETGVTMAGAGAKTPIRDLKRLVAIYGGEDGDWAKKTSSSYLDREGIRHQTHWYENIKTGQRVEPKTKIEYDPYGTK